MKTADKSFSSKAMKVLLSIALVIGLAPAISPAKAYAAGVTTQIAFTDAAGAAKTIENDAVDIAAVDGYAWDLASKTLTVTGAIKDVSVGSAFGAVTIATSAASSNASISSTTGAAITTADADNKLVIDTKAAPLNISTTAANTSAIVAAQALEIAAGTDVAAKKLTVTAAISDDTTPVVVATGAVDVKKLANIAAATIKGAAVSVLGEVTGSTISTSTSAINGTVTGNVSSADNVTVAQGGDATIGGNIITTAAAKTVT
ncbi:MAG: hypothetical protein RR753_04010, partial [Raoultibacter sp.]